MGLPNHHIRLPNRVHWERALNQSSHVDSDSKEAFPTSGSRRGPGNNAPKEGDSPLKSFFPRSRALFLPVPSGETLRWMASHPKSAPTKRSGHPAKVQDGYPSECNEHSRRGHQVCQRCVHRRGGGIGPLAGLLGSPGRVFSRCHKSKRHKISPLRLQRGNFRISGPTYRALDLAPRTFTRLVRAIGAYLRTFGINIFLYLDDWLVVGETHQLALSYRDTVRMITQRVGFLINEEKSDWTPTQFPMFLGSVLDLVLMMQYPSED